MFRVSTAREFKGNETEPSNTTKKLPATPASTVQLGEPKISQQFELGFSRVHGNFADLRLNQSTVLSLLQKMRVENVHKCAEMCCKSNALVLSKAIFQYLTVNEDTLKETIEIMQSKVNRKSCLSKALNNQISLVVLLLVSLYTTQVGCDKLVSSVLKNLRSLCLGSAKKKSPVKLFHYLHGMDSSLQDSFKDTSHAYTYSSSGVAAASSSSGNTETIPISNDARKNVLQSLLQFDTDSDDNSDSDIVSETKGKCEDFGCRDDNSQSSSSSNKLETSGFDVAASHFTDSCEPHLNKVVTERLVDPSIQSSSAGDYENERIPESEINSDLLIEDGGYSIKVNRAGDLRLECKVAAVSLMILCTTTHLVSPSHCIFTSLLIVTFEFIRRD